MTEPARPHRSKSFEITAEVNLRPAESEAQHPTPIAIALDTTFVEEEKISAIPIDDSQIHSILDGKKESFEARTIGLTNYVFEQFDNATGRIFDLPDQLTIAERLFPTTRFMYGITVGKIKPGSGFSPSLGHNSEDHVTAEANFDIILEEITEYRNRSPVAVADQIHKKFPLKKEAQLAQIATILWMAEAPELGLDNLVAKIHTIARKNSPKSADFSQRSINDFHF